MLPWGYLGFQEIRYWHSWSPEDSLSLWVLNKKTGTILISVEYRRSGNTVKGYYDLKGSVWKVFNMVNQSHGNQYVWMALLLTYNQIERIYMLNYIFSDYHCSFAILTRQAFKAGYRKKSAFILAICLMKKIEIRITSLYDLKLIPFSFYEQKIVLSHKNRSIIVFRICDQISWAIMYYEKYYQW